MGTMSRPAVCLRPIARRAVLATLGMTATGCAGRQSALAPFGAEAQSTFVLTAAMAATFALVTIAVLWLAWHAWRSPPERLAPAAGMRMVLWFGAILPSILLGIMLVLSLPTMRALPFAAQDLRIAVDGEQYWWRVRYAPPGGAAIETANEVRVPVGRTVAFALASPDVIHSFWIPGLAGKVDMIPGRTNELVVRATRPGTFRGVCAEFCGLSHAHMAFDVVAMPAAEFDRWLASAARPAAPVAGAGRALFEAYGCGGCHVVRGHGPGSPIGPDLTHFGARRSLGAGTLPMRREAIAAFIRNPAAAKPGALMPAFPAMPPADAAAIAAYLEALR